MRTRKQLRALIFCAAFVLVLLVSSAFIVHEADHDCIGEDCPVCQMIALSTELLRLMGSILLVLLAVLLMTGLHGGIRPSPEGRRIPAAGTLISWKIRLND